MEKQGNTVLVIDTEESIHDSCYQDLSRKGYKFNTASDWKHEMRLVRKLHPDLVLLDPKAAGEEIIQKISLIDSTIVIVETSEYATIESTVKAMRVVPKIFLGMIVAEWILNIPIISYILNPIFIPAFNLAKAIFIEN